MTTAEMKALPMGTRVFRDGKSKVWTISSQTGIHDNRVWIATTYKGKMVTALVAPYQIAVDGAQ